MAAFATKEDIAIILDEIATLLELKGENPFKIRAYQNAARHIEALEDFDRLVAEGKLSSVKGIGEALTAKISELASTGSLAYYENLKKEIPPGHLEMLKIPGLGPKKIIALSRLLAIESVAELETACRENKLIAIPGFGRKTQDKILAGIEHLKSYQARRLYADVITEAEALLEQIIRHPDTVAACIAGSLRRCTETVKDIDIVAASRQPSALGGYFSGLPSVRTIVAKGETKVSVILQSGINSDLRIVTPDAFPYALHHFTGSREHNTAMRGRAKRMGLKMNEYGLFQGEVNIPCRNEAALFQALGLAYIPPELREDVGEIEAAETGTLPYLIEEKDIKGVFHIHTSASDGANTLTMLAEKAKEMGLAYIGISDHSQAAYYAGGLSPEAVIHQLRSIDAINERVAPFHIFKGIEADILPDGSLDYDEDTLARFDFVIAAIHSHFNTPEAIMTQRIVTALSNPYTTMLAHPTGRLLLAREPYAVNMTAVIDCAAENSKIIELNAHPQRLDLDWRHCLYARKKGVKIAINPDAHHLEDMSVIRYGIHIARKGWLGRGDCVNCLGLDEMKALLKRV
jgi:DNA polymerase (family 10)